MCNAYGCLQGLYDNVYNVVTKLCIHLQHCCTSSSSSCNVFNNLTIFQEFFFFRSWKKPCNNSLLFILLNYWLFESQVIIMRMGTLVLRWWTSTCTWYQLAFRMMHLKMWNISYTHGGMKFWWLTFLSYFLFNILLELSQ